MNTQNAAQAAVNGPSLKAVASPDQRSSMVPAAGDPGPALTAHRAGQLIHGQEYAPVIRLEPRRNPLAERRTGKPTGTPAEVIGIDEVEEKRRVTAISKSVGQAAVEVLAGTRPVSQLSRWLDPQSYERLQLRSALVREQRESRNARSSAGAKRLHRNPQVRSARLCRLTSGIYEASLVVVEQSRARAVALRLEYRKEVWKITALEIG
ncbi:Rv3235 family protein [Arthrobacter monumenti]